ncbi:MAG: hypothetical protein EZS28_031575 [Streblomastix strix]|uniref:Protein kinase domain-containing protein n=1 Tax=Streblomastix strix TaxID=222440 RepID=A0A5J4UR23_9EUKA|nr:MAG: hypothetical protein EZS28_031575 [Streblomastix strix]
MELLEVYLSHNSQLGIIAAKIMQSEKFDQREWDAAGRLNQAKSFENNVVILMSYANAKSLDVIIQDKKQNLQSGTYRALAKQILEGVRMIHAAGIIHSSKVKIADFGTAKIITSLNLNVTALGTPKIMAPELLLGTSIGTNKVDMWSVGVVLFQLATHEQPIQAESIPDLQRKMGMLKRITRHPAIVDNILWDLLSQLLEFDPDRRISAEQALQHPYFTSPQAFTEVSIQSRIIAQKCMLNERQLDNEI